MRQLIDKKQVTANRARARRSNVAGADFLLRRALDELADRIATTHFSFAAGLALGPFAAETAAVMEATGKVGHVRQIDFDDDEVLAVEVGACDLVVHLLDLHQINDVPGALIQMRRALRPDGLFLACIPAAGTLAELRESLLAAEAALSGGANARILPLMDVRDAGALLQRTGFALPVTDADGVTVRYDTAFDLMRDLRAMGATNVLVGRRQAPTARQVMFEAARRYAQGHGDEDGRIGATFNFVWMSGWAPAPSQPKPLKPGSATHSLAQVLKSKTK